MKAVGRVDDHYVHASGFHKGPQPKICWAVLPTSCRNVVVLELFIHDAPAFALCQGEAIFQLTVDGKPLERQIL